MGAANAGVVSVSLPYARMANMTLVAPKTGRPELGEVFTQSWVVETILDLVGYTADRSLADFTIVEPAIGAGAFVLPIVERLLASAAPNGLQVEKLVNAIRFFDLQRDHVTKSREIITRMLCDNGLSNNSAQTIVGAWFRVSDFLLDETPITADFVVGNPPYVRHDVICPDLMSKYRSRWTTMKGRVDIFVGFLEKSLSLLRVDGKLGFICADRWMRNYYGSSLRRLIGEKYSVEAIWQMHDVNAFEREVSAYPAITILANQPQGSVTVLEATAQFDSCEAGKAVQFSNSGKINGSGPGWTGTRMARWFRGPDFWPSGGPDRIRLLEDLAERFPTLEETGNDTKISIGIATGADQAYIVSADADVEPDRLLPMVTARDIRSGRLETPTKVMINPWNDLGELVELSSYPKLRRALAAHPAVARRYVAKRNPENWHRTIDKVHPGLQNKPKLLLQDMKAQITPVLEPGGYYPHHNLYYITSSGWDLEILGGLLLSRVAQAFIESYGVKMRGGTLRFQAQYLRKIRVPMPETINPELSERLRRAYQALDRDEATRASELAYGLTEGVY